MRVQLHLPPDFHVLAVPGAQQMYALCLQLHTRAVTLPNYVSTAGELTAVALRLMRADYPLTLRLIGIRCIMCSIGLPPRSVLRCIATFLCNACPSCCT